MTKNNFKEHSVAEFFKKNRQMLGLYGKIRSLTTIFHEFVTNSIDACEEANILPTIEIKMEELGPEYYNIHFIDNGPGISKKQLAKSLGKLLAGTKFHRLIQSVTEDEQVIYSKDNKIHISTISELVDPLLKENQFEKNISKEKIYVPAFDWKKYKYSFKKVKHVIRHPRENEIYDIKTESSRRVKVTGCHSLFGINDGHIKEIEARNLKVGDYIIVPKNIPKFKEIDKINILDYLKYDETESNNLYCYGIGKETIKNIFSKAKIINGKDLKGKHRKYYEFEFKNTNNLKILDDTYKNNYLKKGFLPSNLVLKLDSYKDFEKCKIRSYYHGKIYDFPIVWKLTPSFARFLGLFVAEGHTDKRQIGFTFGKHEEKYINEIKEFAKENNLNTTLEIRDRSLRLKVFGGLLSNLMRNWCGHLAKNKQIPEFIFSANKEIRQHFLDGVYDGDGHNSKNRNQLMHVTISKKLSNQLQYLWLQQEIFATVNKRVNKGLGKNPSTAYVTTIYGNQINKTTKFKTQSKIGTQSHTMLPISLLEGLVHKKVKSFNPNLVYSTLKLGETKEQSRVYKSIINKLTKGIKNIDELNGHKIRQLKYLGYLDKNLNPTSKIKLLRNRLNLIETIEKSDIKFLKIKEINRIDKGFKNVYDLSIPEYENFVCGTGGVSCHNTRGQQGIGASGCILFSQMTTGKPIRAISGRGKGKAQYIELSIDTSKNEPKIHKEREIDRDFKGLAIESKFKEVLYKDGAQSPLEYLKKLAIANPHITIKFQDPTGQVHIFERASEKIPPAPKEVLPHIKSATVDEFFQLVKSAKNKTTVGFMKEHFDRVNATLIADLNKKLDFDIKKTTKRMLNWEKVEKIVKAIQKCKTIAPRTDSIIPIEEEHLKKSIVNILRPEILSVITRKPTVYRGGYPFQIECAIAFGGDAGRTLKTGTDRLEIMRFANRAPLLFDPGSCAITKAVQSIDWKRYNIRDMDNQPLTIVVNLSSVHIPYTSAGKQAITDDEEITAEIRQALMQVARQISLHISRKKKLKEKEERKKIFYKYAKEVALYLSKITNKKEKNILDSLEDTITKKLHIEEIEEKMKKQRERAGMDKYLETEVSEDEREE